MIDVLKIMLHSDDDHVSLKISPREKEKDINKIFCVIY
jgi:hypothetical protein